MSRSVSLSRSVKWLPNPQLQVPQRDQEFINLDALANNANYQYNTGLPNSIPTSAAPSYAPPSIRSIQTSPPPSFHTLSRAGTPRANMRGGDGAELWGVATSTGGALTEAICTSSDTLETIQNLKERVARLEESIGRLLVRPIRHRGDTFRN